MKWPILRVLWGLLLVLAGDMNKTQSALNDLRLEMGNRLGLRDKNEFAPCWVTDFPLLEWNEDEERFFAKDSSSMMF